MRWNRWNGPAWTCHEGNHKVLLDLNLPTQSHSKGRSESRQIVRQEQLWGNWGSQACWPQGGLDSSQGTRAGAQGLEGTSASATFFAYLLQKVEPSTRNWWLGQELLENEERMGEVLQRNVWHRVLLSRILLALAGVRLCGHHWPCQGDSALTRSTTEGVLLCHWWKRAQWISAPKILCWYSGLACCRAMCWPASEGCKKWPDKSLSPPFF